MRLDNLADDLADELLAPAGALLLSLPLELRHLRQGGLVLTALALPLPLVQLPVLDLDLPEPEPGLFGLDLSLELGRPVILRGRLPRLSFRLT